MNKTQLVDALTARLGDRRSAASAVDGILEIIVDTVGSGGSVTLTGFGVFEPRARAARVARNPRTGEAVAVAPTTVPSFRPGTAFKELVGNKLGNGPSGRSAARRPRPVSRAIGAPAAARATTAFSAPAEEPVKPPKAKKAKDVKAAGTVKAVSNAKAADSVKDVKVARDVKEAGDVKPRAKKAAKAKK